MMKSIAAVAAAAAALLGASVAQAATIPSGTVSLVNLFSPSVTIGATSGTYTANAGTTFEITGTGGFAAVAGLNGTMNGTLNFSTIPAIVIPQIVSDFFTFNDGSGGSYDFSVTSVGDQAFVNNSPTSVSGTLYVLGSIVDSHLGYNTPTPGSLTLQFNSTGGSAFSSSATLAVPPAGAAPEPGAWALMIAGVGLAGFAFRRSRQMRLA